MAATVNVNDKTVVHASSDGIATIFPDVCKTPSPGGPVPIPYPNIAKSSDTGQASQNTTMDGNPIMIKGSIYATSTGDEAGSVGGVISGVVKGKAEFMAYSMDVKVEGKNVCRLGDVMGQNESSLNASPGPNVQPPTVAKGKLKREILTGAVTEILFQSGIKLDKDKKSSPVPPDGKPHYKRGMMHKTYSAVYLRESAGGEKKLKVKFKITDLENVDGKGELSGEGGDVRVRAKNVSYEKGKEVEVEMEFEERPNEATYFRQGINWTITVGGKDYPIGSTNVKIFFLYDALKKPFTSTPVWESALEFAFLKCGVKGQDPREMVKKITQYCHTGHGRTYDTVRGGPHFSSSGGPSGSMQLGKYLKLGSRVVNCYDQAIAVITFSAAVGIETYWVYMNPYGYITPTPLVGVGPCNNPFYKMPHPGVMRKKLVPSNAEPFYVVKVRFTGRTSFGNHAFVWYGGKIYDACAGPALGTKTSAIYAFDSIDVSEPYYQMPWNLGHPSSSDMWHCAGYVTDVS